MYLTSQRRKVVLVNPRGDLNDAVALPSENIRVGSLLAYLRHAGVPVELVDADLRPRTPDELLTHIASQSTGLVAAEVLYRTLPYALALTSALACLPPSRRPMIVFQGIAATLSAEDLLQGSPGLDAIILGEGEETLLELARVLAANGDWRTVAGLAYRDADNRIVRSRPRRLIAELDLLPFTARDSLPLALRHKPVIDIATSRGCSGVCSFCSIRPFYATGIGAPWRGRSPDHVAGELEGLIDTYGVTHFAFVDEDFIGSERDGKHRARHLAEIIIARDLQLTFSLYCRADAIEENLFGVLRRAGLRTVSFGMESACQRILDRFDKRITVGGNLSALETLRRLDIRAVPSTILFEPTVTLAEVRETILFLRRHDLTSLIGPTTTIPYRGTRLTHDLGQHGWLRDDRFILRPYIPAVRFADPRVEELLSIWENWQAWVDREFQGVRTILARTHHALAELPEIPQPCFVWSTLLELSSQFKRIESDMVLDLIADLSENTTTPTLEDRLWSASVPSLRTISRDTWRLFDQESALSTALGAEAWRDCSRGRRHELGEEVCRGE